MRGSVTDIVIPPRCFEQAIFDVSMGVISRGSLLTMFVLLINAISPGGRLTRQFLSETRATSARTAGAILRSLSTVLSLRLGFRKLKSADKGGKQRIRERVVTQNRSVIGVLLVNRAICPSPSIYRKTDWAEESSENVRCQVTGVVEKQAVKWEWASAQKSGSVAGFFTAE